MNGVFSFASDRPYNAMDPSTYPERLLIRVPTPERPHVFTHAIGLFAQRRVHLQVRVVPGALFERVVGLERLKAFHGNDSKRPCGSRVDRHEHIGEGCLGLAPFRRLLADPRFAGLPILIETEKSTATGRAGAITLDPLDVKNLDTLRRLRDEGSGSGRSPAA